MPFDVFSKRGKPLPDVFAYDQLPKRLRQQVAYIYADTLCNLIKPYNSGRPEEVFDDIRDPVVREHGVSALLPGIHTSSSYEIKDCILESGDVPIVLDVIEKFTATYSQLRKRPSGEWVIGPHLVRNNSNVTPSDAILELNHRFRENGIGYQFDANSSKLIRVDSLLVHNTVIQPVLLLLSQPAYSVPNAEFLSALGDYKSGNYPDAITKAGSAYESVMKVILAKKNWPHDPTKAASHLVKAIVDNAPLDGGYNQVLLSVANVRNLASSAHGGGTTARVAEEHHCQLMLNLAASAMLYLAEEFG